MPSLPLDPRPRQSPDPGPPAVLGYRERLLLDELQAGRLRTSADARAASRAAHRSGRRDLARRADRVRDSLAARARPARGR